MTISREQLDAGLVDFGDTVKRGAPLPPVSPGEILREEFMVPLNLSAWALAKGLGVPVNRITAILAGRRAITADTALRLGRYFGTSAEFWLNLQQHHDLEIARRELANRLETEVAVPA